MNIIELLMDRIQGKAPKGARRSSQWPKVRDEYLKTHDKCVVCETTGTLRVHHIIPFFVAPDLELDPNNFVTLCENKKYGINCHFLLGHLGNWTRVNSDVMSDVKEWHQKLKG